MLLVKTKIGPSKIHGIGIFADQFIPKGTITWQYKEEFDQIISDNLFETLPEDVQRQVHKYSYTDKHSGKRILCSDDSRFYNHSDNPNTGTNPDNSGQEDIALRDIQIGEEITNNYFNDFGPGDCADLNE